MKHYSLTAANPLSNAHKCMQVDCNQRTRCILSQKWLFGIVTENPNCFVHTIVASEKTRPKSPDKLMPPEEFVGIF